MLRETEKFPQTEKNKSTDLIPEKCPQTEKINLKMMHLDNYALDILISEI